MGLRLAYSQPKAMKSNGILVYRRHRDFASLLEFSGPPQREHRGDPARAKIQSGWWHWISSRSPLPFRSTKPFELPRKLLRRFRQTGAPQ